MSRLEDIIEYGMNDDQAKAFKLSLLWETLCKQEFPGYPITKLKLVKRQMYGRGKLDLLQARVIGAG